MPSPDYPPAIAKLIAIPHPVSLGPGTPNGSAGDQLRRLDAAELFAPATVRDPDMGNACLSGLWLHFDYLDESHTISQEVHTPEGSFWHAIMHRREPDAGNSKYWYRKLGSHAVLTAIEQHAPALGYDYTCPNDFVDFCERVRDRDTPDEEVAKQVQLLEWRLLFDYCLRQAAA